MKTVYPVSVFCPRGIGSRSAGGPAPHAATAFRDTPVRQNPRAAYTLAPVMAAVVMAGLVMAGLVAVQVGCGSREPAESRPAADGPLGAGSNGAPMPLDAGGQGPHSPAATNEPIEPPKVDPGVGNAILPEAEHWYLLMMGSQRIGHKRTTVEHVQADAMAEGAEDGSGGEREMMQVAGLLRINVKRFGQASQQEIRFSCLEHADGRLAEFTSRIAQGNAPVVARGTVEGDRLRVTVASAGRTREHTLPWTASDRAFFAVEQSLLRRPMRPGERRELRTLQLDATSLGTERLEAQRWERVELPRNEEGAPSDQRVLLRIRQTTATGEGGVLRGTIWTDAAGNIWKSQVEGGLLRTYRVDRQTALADTGPGDLDLAVQTSIPLAEPLPRPHENALVRYRLTLTDDNPAEVFPESASQAVEPIDKRSAEVTVWALRPGRTGNAKAPEDKPTDADSKPSSIVQSDDPLIVEMAQSATADAESPWEKAVAAERFVGRVLTNKSFSQTFASAADVARSREGDCTEHSVLLVALLRAVGIPARGAAGLVYMPGRQAFFFHMWAEAYIDGRWIPLDATIAQGGTGGAHLKLITNSLGERGYRTAFLPVFRVLGKLKIELIEARPTDGS